MGETAAKGKIKSNAGPYAGSCSNAVCGHYPPTTSTHGLNMDLTDPKRQQWSDGVVVWPVPGAQQALYAPKTAEKRLFG